MRFYTYAWVKDNTPYYIGKGQGNRAFVQSGHKCPKPNVKADIIILKYFDEESSALNHEKYLIHVLGRKSEGGILENKTCGGQGMSGYSMTEVTKEKLRQVIVSDETRQKMSLSKQGYIPWNKGKTGVQIISEETKLKMRLAKLGKKRGPYKKRS